MKRGYAFIEFDDSKDAEIAIREMDNKRIEGQRIVVQAASKNQFRNFNFLIYF